MPVKYDIHNTFNVIIVELSGVIIISDLLEYMKTVLKDSKYRHGMKELIDLRNVEDISLVYGDLQTYVKKLKNLKLEKSAVVAASDFFFGMANMYQALSFYLPMEVMAFRYYDEARLWLGLPSSLKDS